jgi:hypothetical protein
MHEALHFMRPDGVVDRVWKEQAEEVFAQLFGYTPETVLESVPRYYRCFVSGSKILQREQLPGRGFTYNFMTGFEDPESDTQRGRTWCGLMRIMTGPQVWVNMFMSLLILMMSSAARGTMIVGPGVFENLNLAKKEYAQPGSVIQANRADFRDKMEVIAPQGVPQSMFQALGMFGDMVPSLVGINPEYDLGQARDLRRVSGEALSQVKDAANAISAALVDSFAQYRQNLGMRYLEQLRKYIPEGQAVRIYNGFQPQDEQITRQEIFGRYDVVVDEAPDTRTSGEETIAQLMEQGNFQIMMTGGPGGAPLIPYSMLPSLFKGLSPEKREEMQQWTNMLTQAAMAQFAPPPPQGPPGQGGPPPGPPQ